MPKLASGSGQKPGRPQPELPPTRGGDFATIELMSEDFDSYLFLVGPGLPEPLSDDDGGEGLNSRLAISFPADGVYRVVASSLGGATGTFTLRVR